MRERIQRALTRVLMTGIFPSRAFAGERHLTGLFSTGGTECFGYVLRARCKNKKNVL